MNEYGLFQHQCKGKTEGISFKVQYCWNLWIEVVIVSIGMFVGCLYGHRGWWSLAHCHWHTCVREVREERNKENKICSQLNEVSSQVYANYILHNVSFKLWLGKESGILWGYYSESTYHPMWNIYISKVWNTGCCYTLYGQSLCGFILHLIWRNCYQDNLKHGIHDPWYYARCICFHQRVLKIPKKTSAETHNPN